MRSFSKDRVIGILLIIIVFLFVLLTTSMDVNKSYEAKVIIQEDMIKDRNAKILELKGIIQNMDEQFEVYSD